MLLFSMFLAGFTLGIFAALKIFSPEKSEEAWDPQHFPKSFRVKSVEKSKQATISEVYPLLTD